MISQRRRVGILGGTFDPIHVGHLAMAGWARDGLGLDEVRLIPTGRSWQKGAAGSDGVHRLAMTELAAAHRPGLSVDNREVRRGGATYTIDTLIELRTELGPEVALVLLLGSDQLHNLASWHRYQDLLEYAHIAVTRREQIALDGLPPAVEALVAAHGRDALPDTPSGAIVFFRMAPVPVSATAIRAALLLGERPEQLVPRAVLDYIDQHHLYR